jgi:hypothetical protein
VLVELAGDHESKDVTLAGCQGLVVRVEFIRPAFDNSVGGRRWRIFTIRMLAFGPAAR